MSGSPPPAQTDGWPTASPEAAGFSPDLADRIDAGVRDGRFENLHAVLVARDGQLVAERYYEGADEALGRPLGVRTFGSEDLHDLRSITKSVVGLLYGIALAEGLVPPAAATLLDHFREYRDLASDPARRRLTVAHALTMTLGTAWDEGLSYADPRNSERAMELADDRCRYVLDRPMVSEPGTRWIYNGGASALLGALITRGSGRPLRDYAEEKLFRPLGIARYEWLQGRDGTELAASGLRLRPRDLAKIGRLAVGGGTWDGRQLVPSDWLAASFEPHAETESGNYGYQWWLGPTTEDGGPLWIAGFGNGGQRLFLGPRRRLAVVVMAGNYNRPDAWKLPVAVITEIVLPAITRR